MKKVHLVEYVCCRQHRINHLPKPCFVYSIFLQISMTLVDRRVDPGLDSFQALSARRTSC